MKLYLSSIRVPEAQELEKLIGKPLTHVRLALIPNAKDYYAGRAWHFKVNDCIEFFERLGAEVSVVDLRRFDTADDLRVALAGSDIIWAMGGNTFCLRYEMRRSGFEQIIRDLLEAGIVYGGDSAGALVAGTVIGGIGVELADEPEFAEKVIREGLNLVPYIVMPHIDNPEFAYTIAKMRSMSEAHTVIELRDSQAVIFSDGQHRIINGQVVDVT